MKKLILCLVTGFFLFTINPLQSNAETKAVPVTMSVSKTAEIAETIEFLVSDKSKSLRETVLKIYNNA